jgi:hypothetical protein
VKQTEPSHRIAGRAGSARSWGSESSLLRLALPLVALVIGIWLLEVDVQVGLGGFVTCSSSSSYAVPHAGSIPVRNSRRGVTLTPPSRRDVELKLAWHLVEDKGTQDYAERPYLCVGRP